MRCVHYSRDKIPDLEGLNGKAVASERGPIVLVPSAAISSVTVPGGSSELYLSPIGLSNYTIE